MWQSRRPRVEPGRNRRSLLLAATLALVALLAAASVRAATITESFMNATAPGWVLGGSATLTSGGADPAGNGWLRLTPATTNQAGYAYYNTAYATANGFVIEFEYGSWGGTSADGFVVYLFDGATPSFNTGDFGGSLGYANGCSPTPGLSRAYIGIAFDEFGNFSNPGDRCKNGGPGARPNSVTIRGEGNGVDNGTNYFYLTHNQLPTATQRLDCPSSLCGTTRPAASTYYRQVRITMYPSGGTYSVQVETRFAVGNSYETVINTYTLPTPIYPTLKIGFSASTGGSTNNHEVRNLRIDVFDKLADKAATGGFTGPLTAGAATQFQVAVTNNGPDTETGPITVTSTLAAGLSYTGYSGSGWLCSNAGSLVTCTRSGSLASGASTATLNLNLLVSAGAAGSTITNTATVSGAVFDNVAGNNTVSSTRFVYGGTTSGAKAMYMYFSGAAGANANTLQRTVPAADSLSGAIAFNASTPWMVLTPAFVRPFTISAGTVQVPVCLQKPTGSSAQNRNIQVTLETIGTTTTTIGSQTINNALSPNDFTWRTVNFAIPVASAINLAAGTQVRARVTNLSSGNGTRTIALRSFNAACGTGYSRVEVGSSTVVNVDSVGVFNAAWPGGTAVTTTPDNGATLYLRSTISDPFGSFDISGADYALFNAANTQVGATAAMTLVNDNVATGQRTYQYPFTTPGYAGSVYTLRVTGREGTEGTVSHVNATALAVSPLPPLLSVSKIASATSAAPGSDIGYTVSMSNLGAGNAKTVLVTDVLDPFTMLRVDTYGPLQPFQFVEGSPASTLLMGTPEYSNDNGATWTYVPVSGGGGAPAGYDAAVTRARVPMTGTLPPGGTFSLNYTVKVR